MRNFRKAALLTALCAVMVTASGCALKDKVTTAIDNKKSASDCVTLGEYKTVSLKTADIDKDVQSKIDESLNNYSTYTKIKSGKIKTGDTVNIYYVGRVDGKTFEGGSCTKKTYPSGYDLEIGSNSFIPGFEDGLVGKKVGTTVKVNCKFPDNYTNNTKLSGKKAVFTVTINSKQGKKVTPKLTDAFVKKNLTTYKSVADYKATLRKEAIENLAWEKVNKDSKVTTYPKEKVDAMYKQLHTSITYYLSQNNYKLSDYIKAQNTTSADFKKQLRSTAKEDIGKQLVYGAIAEKQNITVSDKDYKAELKTYLTNYNCKDEAALDKIFKQYYGSKAASIIKEDLLFTKVKEYLVKNVKES